MRLGHTRDRGCVLPHRLRMRGSPRGERRCVRTHPTRCVEGARRSYLATSTAPYTPAGRRRLGPPALSPWTSPVGRAGPGRRPGVDQALGDRSTGPQSATPRRKVRKVRGATGGGALYNDRTRPGGVAGRSHMGNPGILQTRIGTCEVPCLNVISVCRGGVMDTVPLYGLVREVNRHVR